MKVRSVLSVAMFAAFALAAAPAGAQSIDLADYQTQADTSLSRALWFGQAPAAPSNEFFIIEQRGRVMRQVGVNTTPAVFLDIQLLVLGAGGNSEFNTPPYPVSGLQGDNEQGLLGIAFHPEYNTVGSPNNGYFFVYYIEPRLDGMTNTNFNQGRSRIVRYTRSTISPATALSASAFPVLSFDQPFSNHNGGNMMFGSDGFLYIGTGDGGSGDDPLNLAANPNSLHGKMLRINVNGDDFPAEANRNYRIPAGNPTSYPTATGTTTIIRREAWAIGLRNPWRWSFDRLNGNLWIGDVGQNEWEEINVVPGNGGPGRHYGWRFFEAAIVAGNSAGAFSFANTTFPIYNYPHNASIVIPPGQTYLSTQFGVSVTGGFVYRGSAIPHWRGRYFFADYISSRLWSFRYANGAMVDFQNHTSQFSPAPSNIVSFAEDNAGELYSLHFVSPRIRKFVPNAIAGTIKLCDVATDSLDQWNNPNRSVGPEDLDAFIAGFISNNEAIADVASDSLDTVFNPNGFVGPEDLDAFIASFVAGN